VEEGVVLGEEGGEEEAGAKVGVGICAVGVVTPGAPVFTPARAQKLVEYWMQNTTSEWAEHSCRRDKEVSREKGDTGLGARLLTYERQLTTP